VVVMALEAFESWGSKQWPSSWRARGARAYNGGLGAEPPVGSRGRAPGGGQGAKPPWSWKLFGSWTSHGAAKLIPLSVFSKVFNRDMVQIYSQNLVSMVRIGCAVRKWIDFYETSSFMPN